MTGLEVAQQFNREVLKGQLSENGATVAELGRRIEAALQTEVERRMSGVPGQGTRPPTAGIQMGNG